MYAVIAVAFLSVISYAIFYNLKMKSHDKSLNMPGGAAGDTPSKILAEKHAEDRARSK